MLFLLKDEYISSTIFVEEAMPKLYHNYFTIFRLFVATSGMCNL
jgi:hypothetical protein